MKNMCKNDQGDGLKVPDSAFGYDESPQNV